MRMKHTAKVPSSPVSVFLAMRAKLIEMGLRCPIAETYAKDAVVRWKAALATDKDATEAFSDARARYYVELHKAAP